MSGRESATLGALRGGLLIILVLGLIGVLSELLLLEHTEDPWQRVPIFLLIGSLIIAGWHLVERKALSVRFLQGAMALFVISGALGLLLHFRGNVAFELEMQPSARGWPLIWAALRGATPALAPGTMVQLGLIGLAYTYHHPALRARQPVAGRSVAPTDAPERGRP
jgi:hypothetical protein